MARTRWLSIKVELLSGRDIVLEHPVGRVMIASPRHTLADLAEAIDIAFARRDHSHLHASEFGDGRRFMLGGRDFEAEMIDSTGVTLSSLDLDVRTSFEYVFDLGDDWRHRCEVQSTEIDPERSKALLLTCPCRSGAGAGYRTSTAAAATTSSPSPGAVIAELPGKVRQLRQAQGGQCALPRLCVKPDEAAEMLGVSRDYFDEHVKPELRIIRHGSRTVLVPLADLVRWVERNAARSV